MEQILYFSVYISSFSLEVETCKVHRPNSLVFLVSNLCSGYGQLYTISYQHLEVYCNRLMHLALYFVLLSSPLSPICTLGLIFKNGGMLSIIHTIHPLAVWIFLYIPFYSFLRSYTVHNIRSIALSLHRQLQSSVHLQMMYNRMQESMPRLQFLPACLLFQVE